MAVKDAYFDTAFLFRLYWEDPGWKTVRQFAARQMRLVCAVHGRAEVISCAHRKRREGVASEEVVAALLDQFALDQAQGGIRWLDLSEDVFRRVEAVYRAAPPDLNLRAADALHLAAAAEAGCREIYSNDCRLLAAADRFGVRGIDLVA